MVGGRPVNKVTENISYIAWKELVFSQQKVRTFNHIICMQVYAYNRSYCFLSWYSFLKYTGNNILFRTVIGGRGPLYFGHAYRDRFIFRIPLFTYFLDSATWSPNHLWWPKYEHFSWGSQQPLCKQTKRKNGFLTRAREVLLEKHGMPDESQWIITASFPTSGWLPVLENRGNGQSPEQVRQFY